MKKEEELRQATANDQVPNEVVLEVVKVTSKEELQKAEFDARVQLAFKQVLIYFMQRLLKETAKLQPTMVHETIAKEKKRGFRCCNTLVCY